MRSTNEIFVSFIYSYCLNNPLKYTDPTGYSYKKSMEAWYGEGNYWYRGQAAGTWSDWESYHNIGGGGSYSGTGTGNGEYGLPGQSYGEGTNGPGVGGIYYDCVSHTFRLIDNPKAGGFYIEANAFEAFTVGLLNNASGQGVRPDGDGYLTLDEANYWYNNGNGQPLSADLSKINLRSVSVDDFRKAGDSKYFNLLFYSNSRNDGLVYGSIKLTYMGPTWNVKGGIVSAEYDIYDFDLRDWNSVGNLGRNLETIIGSQVAGPGTAYRINFYNYGLISGPRPPVIY